MLSGCSRKKQIQPANYNGPLLDFLFTEQLEPNLGLVVPGTTVDEAIELGLFAPDVERDEAYQMPALTTAYFTDLDTKAWTLYQNTKGMLNSCSIIFASSDLDEFLRLYREIESILITALGSDDQSDTIGTLNISFHTARGGLTVLPGDIELKAHEWAHREDDYVTFGFTFGQYSYTGNQHAYEPYDETRNSHTAVIAISVRPTFAQ